MLSSAALEALVEALAEQVHVLFELRNGGFLEVAVDLEYSSLLMNEVNVGDLPLVIEDIVSQLAHIRLGQ